MNKMISPEDIVACICEGKTEENIINILLDKEDLIFTREQLLDDKLLRGKYRSPEYFTNQYLTMDYENRKIVILSIQDNKNPPYTIKKAYNHKIKGNHLVVTAPEIEMLMIHSAGLYNEYNKVKSNTKPSQFLSNKWEVKEAELKSTGYIINFFNKHNLLKAIEKHSQKCKKNKKNILLNNLLKK